MKPRITIYRDFQDHNQSLGVCRVSIDGVNVFKSQCIERGWRNNERGVSCIPEGEYKVVLEYSPRFKKYLWEIYGVPDRSECKFHAVNFARDLNGCVGLGESRRDIDKDGYFDVTNSKDTMIEFHKSLKGYEEAILIVKNRL